MRQPRCSRDQNYFGVVAFPTVHVQFNPLVFAITGVSVTGVLEYMQRFARDRVVAQYHHAMHAWSPLKTADACVCYRTGTETKPLRLVVHPASPRVDKRGVPLPVPHGAPDHELATHEMLYGTSPLAAVSAAVCRTASAMTSMTGFGINVGSHWESQMHTG